MSMNKTCAISSWISFLTSAAISVFAQRLRAQYDLYSIADSREQTRNAKSVRLSLNSDLDASALILLKLSACRAVAFAQAG